MRAKGASFAFAKRKEQRTEKLFNKKAVPFHVLDEAKADAVLAATELRNAEQNKRMAELELERARAGLALRPVRWFAGSLARVHRCRRRGHLDLGQRFHGYLHQLGVGPT